MKDLRKKLVWGSLLALMMLLLASGCAHIGVGSDPDNETQVLLDFFENERDYLHTGGSFVITAQDLRLELLTRPNELHLIDIRSPEDFAIGYIEGAVRIDSKGLYQYVKSIDASAYENIVLISCDGQSTAYFASLLRAAGYSNVKSLKWGMSSWAYVFAEGAWLTRLSSQRISEFVHTESPSKNEPGPLPRINTGKTNPEEILEARLEKLFAEGHELIMVDHDAVFNDLYSNGKFYIVNYWSPELYKKQGHIPGAINYPPETQPFKSENDLFTLSTDGPNVLYCFTGQTSAYVSGYLRILGYDARSLEFGANAMIFDRMKQNNVPNTFLRETEIMNYNYVSGGQ
jgi:rhodanese-related sulfurtransferase